MKPYQTPPPGWFDLGTHVDRRPGALLIFSEELGDDGLPLWEKPVGHYNAGPGAPLTRELAEFAWAATREAGLEPTPLAPVDPYVEEADANPERRSNGCMIYRVGQ